MRLSQRCTRARAAGPATTPRRHASHFVPKRIGGDDLFHVLIDAMVSLEDESMRDIASRRLRSGDALTTGDLHACKNSPENLQTNSGSSASLLSRPRLASQA
jgi:hypothetical protein